MIWENKLSIRIVIAGGGTGGHLFPGIALAHAFRLKDPENRVRFIGTGRPLETTVVSAAGFEHQRLQTEGIKGRGIGRQIMAALKIPMSICRSIGILLRFKPDLTIGVGGYVSGPVVIAAWLLAIKTVICEQNILPGITNRILVHFCARFYASFAETNQYIKTKKMVVSGNPVRREMIRPLKNPHEGTGSWDGSPGFTVLILGGSQGAHGLNTAVMDAVARLEIKRDIFFIHQTGEKDMTGVQAAYATHGVAADTRAFISDMAEVYQKADLIVCRAGATTIAEITAMGKPTIFVPYPFAADNHQELNARVLSEQGAARIILERDLSGRRLLEMIHHYYDHPRELKKMASLARNMGRPEAADVIVNDCYRLLGVA